MPPWPRTRACLSFLLQQDFLARVAVVTVHLMSPVVLMARVRDPRPRDQSVSPRVVPLWVLSRRVLLWVYRSLNQGKVSCRRQRNPPYLLLAVAMNPILATAAHLVLATAAHY